jgi:hypothetical protein
MAIELTQAKVGDLLAAIGEHDLQAPQAISSALDWISVAETSEEAESPDRVYVIYRHELQVFLWYVLPLKYLAPLEDKLEAARALAAFFDRLGESGTAYAEVCRSEATREIIELWEREDPGAGKRLRELLDESGLEPPDTTPLEWGEVMGPEEASIRDLVSQRLEAAIETGELDVGARGFARAQAELVESVLRDPAHAEAGAGSCLARIDAERLDDWLQGRSIERREILTAAAELLRDGVEGSGETLALPPGDHSAPLAPLRWLLEQASGEPIPLTQTGVINRALVRRSVEVFNRWWESRLHGSPHREFDVWELEALRELLLRRRLLRRRGRTLQLTGRGRRLLGDGDALVAEGLRALFGVEPFEDAIGELQLAYLLAHGGALERTTAMDEAVHAAIVADGWRSGPHPPPPRFTGGTHDGPLSLAVMLGILRREHHFDRATYDSWTELEADGRGRELLRRALWLQATGPRREL